MPQTLFLKPPFVSPPSNHTFWKSNSKSLSDAKIVANPVYVNFKVRGRLKIVCMGMLAPRKFMQKRRKVEVFKDAVDEADQKSWRRLMEEIDESGSAVSVLRSERMKNQELPRDFILGTLKRFKQLRKWNLVSERFLLREVNIFVEGAF